MTDRIKITVDGRGVEVDQGALLIQAAEENGVYIPRFCWHKRMAPVGMCRMCLVEVEGPRGVALVPSCTTRVAPDMVVHTESETVKKAQEGVLEFLLINHPLDCPVCDRAGECPLQDQTMAYGPGESRFVEEKRHFEKPIPISDLVMLDRERCILCARCTRFSEEISGDPLIEFVDRGNGTQVLTFTDEPFASYFSGNTVEICPVGALTAVPYRFRARPWDLEAVESSCSDCAVGCRVSVQASQNQILRVNGVDSDPVNHGWLCDKGRFAFEATSSEARLDAPLLRDHDGELAVTSWTTALDMAAERLGALGAGEIAGLGGARSTNEEAYAFGKFLRSVADTPHLDAQLGDGLDPQFLVGVEPRATIDDLDTASAILLWAQDLKEELPVLYLRVRRAATELGIPLVVVHPRRTGLDDVATHKITYRPGEAAAVLAGLAGESGGAAGGLLAGERVVALVGRTGLAEDAQVAESVAAFVRDREGSLLMPLVRRSNTYGALDMGVAPTLLPGRASARDEQARAALEERWGPIPAGAGKAALGILEGLAEGSIKGLVLLGSDPVSDFGDPDLARRALQAAEVVVALDTFGSPSVAMADVAFPVLGFAEVEGTVTNLEGRVQKVNQLVPGPGSARPAWGVIEDLAARMGGSIGAASARAIADEIAELAPAYRGISWEALTVGPGRYGLVVPLDGDQPLRHIPVAATATRSADGLALHMARVLYDGGLRVGLSPSLAPLAPRGAAYLNPADAARLSIDESMRVRASTDGTSADLAVRLDDTLAEGTVYIPYQLSETAGLAVTPTVRIEVI